MAADPASRHWLVDLQTLAARLRAENDVAILQGWLPLRDGETIEDVRVRVTGRPTLTLVKGGQADG